VSCAAVELDVSGVDVELDMGMGTINPTHALNANTANAKAISFSCFMTISHLYLTPTEWNSG